MDNSRKEKEVEHLRIAIDCWTAYAAVDEIKALHKALMFNGPEHEALFRILRKEEACLS